MKSLVALVAGVVFGVGLVISGMTNPNKVIGFLDIFGDWDYALAFVMGGAVFVNLIFFNFILNRKPLLNDAHDIPKTKAITKELILGSSLFGIGWGMAGICPGPGLVNLVSFEPSAVIFVISMSLGMIIFKFLDRSH